VSDIEQGYRVYGWEKEKEREVLEGEGQTNAITSSDVVLTCALAHANHGG